ncbi:MAG: MFS transporter [Pseudomonadota bacterium]
MIRILRNRNFACLFCANALLGTAFPIQLILGGLAGLMLAPSPALATLPAAVQTLAGLLSAAPFSLLMGRFGRRTGFALGAVVTFVGGVLAIQALAHEQFALLCAAHFLMGSGWAAFQYFRFAAGEAVAPALRPVAISLMLSALLFAALLGPQLFILTRDALAPFPLAGAYAASGAVAVLGLLPLAFLRMARPERSLPAPVSAPQGRLAALRRPEVRQAIGIAAVAQGLMVFLMVPTPIAMIACGFSDTMASDVVRWHIVAMFAPSFVTGALIQRFGARAVALSGMSLIAVAALSASLGLTAAHFYGALIVLGLGWNLGFIGATALLEEALSEDEKAAVQGANDTIIALVSTIGAFASGAVMSGFGWAALAVISMGLALLAVLVLTIRRAARA